MPYQEYKVVAPTWVPPEKRDSAWYITKKLFRCRIPYFQTLSPDYIKFMGMRETRASTCRCAMN
jgi:hypothetical protein